MILYNQIHEVNNIADTLLEILKITKLDCGRFRDIHLLIDNTIRILARNGYEKFDHILVDHPNFIKKFPAPSDNTFVYYILSVPTDYEERTINMLYKTQKDTDTLEEKLENYNKDLKNGTAKIPQTIVDMLSEVLNSKGDKTIGIFDDDFKSIGGK